MSKITLNNISSFQNDNSAVTNYNNNNAAIETGFDNTLSRDGTSPNQMESNLDMNNFHILNLPEPSSDTDPVRKIDLTNVSTITNLIHTASSTSNTIGTGTKTFTVPTGLGFQVGQYVLIQQNGNTANFMSGRVTSYSGTSLVVSVTNTGGSGTIANWTIDVSGAPGSNGATGATGPTGPSGTPVNVYDTRTIAISASIPGTINVVKTLAYDSSYTADSGATFKRVSAGTPFTDTVPLTGTLIGGSGYTNGTYYGVNLTGGTGIGCFAVVVVSGNTVTSVSFATQPGTGYSVGDVLSIPAASVGGTGTGASFTITTISTPRASFVNTNDSSRWQYIPEGFTHVNQFGAKPDWTGSDGTSTDNFAAIQAALFFGGRQFPLYGDQLGGYQGDTVRLGSGSYMINSPGATSLIVPGWVYLEGVMGSTIKISDSFDVNTHCICLGDPNMHLAQFKAGLRNLTIYCNYNIAVSANVFLVYSNNTQDGGGMYGIFMYAGQRGGFKYETGYGGAATVTFEKIQISIVGSTPAVFFNVGTTLIICRDWSLNAPSVGLNNTVNAIALTGSGGAYNFENIHMEGFPSGVNINVTSGNVSMISFKNVTGGFNMVQTFILQSTNNPGNTCFQNCQKNNGSGTYLVNNGQSGGVSRSADILPKDGIVFFNP